MNSDDQNATEGNRTKHGMGKVIFVHLTDSSLDSTRSHVFCSKLQGWNTCDRRIYVIVYPILVDRHDIFQENETQKVLEVLG